MTERRAAPRRPATRDLGHLAVLRCADSFWQHGSAARADRLAALLDDMRGVADVTHAYQLSGYSADADLLLWCGVREADAGTPAAYFRRFAAALAPHRHDVALIRSFWGLTGPSQYTRVRSTQEIDPFEGPRANYLVAYPFTKTAAWYLLPDERRREMMMEHIRVGREYREINQLLLYSTGLQDQEFVVMYETGDLTRFSDLVRALRATAGRAYTLTDVPILTGHLLTAVPAW